MSPLPLPLPLPLPFPWPLPYRYYYCDCHHFSCHHRHRSVTVAVTYTITGTVTAMPLPLLPHPLLISPRHLHRVAPNACIARRLMPASRYATLRHVTLRYATLRYATLGNIALCRVSPPSSRRSFPWRSPRRRSRLPRTPPASFWSFSRTTGAQKTNGKKKKSSWPNLLSTSERNNGTNERCFLPSFP